MNKRRFLRVAVGLPAVIGLAAHTTWVAAQAPKALRRVGVFLPDIRGRDDILMESFYEEMRKLGWVEGKTVSYDRVYADSQMNLMPRLAAELVARKPDLILAISPPGSSAIKQATSTIPVVFAVVVDPIRAGLVSNLARPGGNMTGITQSSAESLAPKRVQLLRDILPNARRIGVLGNSLDPGSMADQAAIAPLVDKLNLTLVVADATSAEHFEASVVSLIEQKVQAILIANGIALSLRARMAELTTSARIPLVGFNAPLAEAGALLSYGPSIVDQIRRAAYLVDKVLRGAKPSDTPVEAATLIELVVNLKSASALGITVPRAVLLRADRIIE